MTFIENLFVLSLGMAGLAFVLAALEAIVLRLPRKWWDR